MADRGERPGCATGAARESGFSISLNSAHIRQSRPESGLGFQVNAIKPCKLHPLRSAAGLTVEGDRRTTRPPLRLMIWNALEDRNLRFGRPAGCATGAARGSGFSTSLETGKMTISRPGLPPPRPTLPRATCGWKREFKLPWREAVPPNPHDDKVDSDQ